MGDVLFEFRNDPDVGMYYNDISINVGPLPSTFSFHDGVNGKVANLSWEHGVLKLTGDWDAATKVLFEQMLKPHVEAYIKDVMPHDNLKYLEWCATQKEKENAKIA